MDDRTHPRQPLAPGDALDAARAAGCPPRPDDGWRHESAPESVVRVRFAAGTALHGAPVVGTAVTGTVHAVGS